MRVLFIADVIGSPGRRVLGQLVRLVRADTRADAVIVNGENSAGGFGITPEIVKEIFELGVAVITTGNHVWDKKEILPMLDSEPRLLRPANYPSGPPPSGNPGHGSVVVQVGDARLAVLNLQGRTFMAPIDDPFREADALLKELKSLEPPPDAIVVDFHAEATSEKQAFARYLDGRVAAVVGTHTHVQTADERRLPKGTAYITDLGMTGGLGGIIGMKWEISLERQLTQTRGERMQPADEDLHLQGVVVDIDVKTGLSRSIERVSVGMERVLTEKFGKKL
ncbi:TIGR00282 family metallophosphoesterase [Longimicrobium sp.]|uniref:TIGR00282 family metallophosphoesterase n=1 Tax=Longimicrobium sp. TaxID=2029185 RepID=UPI002CA8BAE4|nr:TIGR00282 family metallophosphoesterase [Longimicrobium sp.]HSU14841.1 TIGR00282 family metallophosphoesterase [Longimicrobium sp.]